VNEEDIERAFMAIDPAARLDDAGLDSVFAFDALMGRINEGIHANVPSRRAVVGADSAAVSRYRSPCFSLPAEPRRQCRYFDRPNPFDFRQRWPVTPNQ